MSEETKEAQADEREALVSIYEGDDAFKQINPTTFQYKVRLTSVNNWAKATFITSKRHPSKNKNKFSSIFSSMAKRVTIIRLLWS